MSTFHKHRHGLTHAAAFLRLNAAAGVREDNRLLHSLFQMDSDHLSISTRLVRAIWEFAMVKADISASFSLHPRSERGVQPIHMIRDGKSTFCPCTVFTQLERAIGINPQDEALLHSFYKTDADRLKQSTRAMRAIWGYAVAKAESSAGAERTL